MELRYVCELPIENNAVKLTIPNTIAPQYSVPPDDCDEKTAADQVTFTNRLLLSTFQEILGKFTVYIVNDTDYRLGLILYDNFAFLTFNS